MRKTLIFLITMLLAFMFSMQNAQAAVKNRTAISPYVQTDNDATYTFVGISHPSLNTATTQVGLTIATTGLDGANPSSSFTVEAGETYRVFIVSTNHSTINSTTITGDRVVFLSTTTGGASGQVRITLSATDPDVSSPLASGIQTTRKFNNLNQLSMWGAIVIPSTSTGFAMEFIGDAHDSSALITSTYAHQDQTSGGTFALGRGVN